jgi:DNA replication protein DnaC
MDTKQHIMQHCQYFKMKGLLSGLDQLIAQAENKGMGYLQFTQALLQLEADHRERSALLNRLKVARLPRSHDLAGYDHSVDNALSKARVNQLLELNWLDQVYNIILMGPSGVGKTFVAAGLCHQAATKGYKAYFRSMEELIGMLKMKDMARSAKGDYKRLLKADLIVIDDIMLFPVEKSEAVTLFNFINQLYEKTSFIITTNKKPAEWAQMLGDEVLATALLDRLLYRCEVISLSGKSYRLQNRKTIFTP